MALGISTFQNRIRLPLLILASIACFAVVGWLLYDALVERGGFRLQPPYSYSLNQSVQSNVSYVDNSYFPGGPGTNTAYISDLTDSIRTNFRYDYKGSSIENLEYTYDITATVKGAYSVPGSDQEISNVWTRQFQLVKPKTVRVSADKFSISQAVTIPFADYRKLVEDFRLSLALPVTSELEVHFNVQTKGTIRGEVLNDMRSSTISTPLNVQIYQLATKYDKTDSKELNNRPQQDGGETIRAEVLGAVLMTLVGAGFIVLTLRHAIQKSPYERELQKIYRYHDSIIIRTSRRMEIPASKTVVAVKSFDDILNLEEETKLPIIAVTLGDVATQFMIVQDDIVYIYTLGEEPVDVIRQSQMQVIEESIEENANRFSDVKRVRRKTAKKKSE